MSLVTQEKAVSLEMSFALLGGVKHKEADRRFFKEGRMWQE